MILECFLFILHSVKKNSSEAIRLKNMHFLSSFLHNLYVIHNILPETDILAVVEQTKGKPFFLYIHNISHCHLIWKIPKFISPVTVIHRCGNYSLMRKFKKKKGRGRKKDLFEIQIMLMLVLIPVIRKALLWENNTDLQVSDNAQTHFLIWLSSRIHLPPLRHTHYLGFN